MQQILKKIVKFLVRITKLGHSDPINSLFAWAGVGKVVLV